MLSFTLLGHVELLKNGQLLHGFRSQKEPALLIYLAQTGQQHQRDVVAELLWDNRSTKQSLSNLRTVLARLQHQVGDSLAISHRSLALRPESQQQVDSVKLLQTLTSIEQITCNSTATTLQQALDSYRGDFLAHFQLRNASGFEEWMLATREYIRRQVVAAYHKLAQYALSTGDAERGMTLARRWLQVDTLDESAHTLLIRLLIEMGNIREATAHYNHCAELLRTELGIEPPTALTGLIKDIQPKRVNPSRSFAAMRHNLPAPHDQFFGRKATQHGMHMRLDQDWCRLVTIVGPGGMGKTRLATTVARNRLNQYPDGVWLVELAELDPNDDDLSEAIAVEIATALELRFTGSAAPSKQLLDHLQHKRMMLVLDNFEHLLKGVQMILDIVRRCEYVQMLVTSREQLRLRAEWTVALTGLSYPGNGTDDAPAEAVELFAARRDQQRWETLSADELSAIHTICRMVEGLPLAIELAAALAHHATPQTVAERLQEGFDALTSSLRDVPQRHQSLQVVFEMSWRALTPALQQRLARLSVFRDSFAATVAQQIAEADAQQLAALGEKSLLSYDASSDRYRLHAVIRGYAATKRPASDQTPQHHAYYYLTLLAQHSESLQKHRPQDSMTLLEPDIDNLRLAWQTALAQRRADWLLAALTSLSVYYQLRGLAREGEAIMHTTLDTATAWGTQGSVLAARAGLERARFQNRLGRYWPAILSIKTALRLASQNADRWAEGMGHVVWGEALWRLGEYESARNKLSHALDVAQAIDSTLIVGWCHHHFGVIDDIRSRYDTAHEHLQRACDAWRSLDNTATLSSSLNSIGLVCYHQGDLAAAQQAMEQALALCVQLDNRHLQGLLLNNLSMVAIEQSDYTAAHRYLQTGLELAIASGNLTGQGEIYTNLGRNYCLLGETELAAESLEQGLRIVEALGNRTAMATVMLRLAEVKRTQRDATRVESLYNQALHIAQQDKLPHIECDLLIAMAEFVSETKPRQARQYSLEAVALAESIGNPQLIERANLVAHELRMSIHTHEKNLSA